VKNNLKIRANLIFFKNLGLGGFFKNLKTTQSWALPYM
jgi:hypothetical protein